jgi:hypothetical protein
MMVGNNTFPYFCVTCLSGDVCEKEIVFGDCIVSAFDVTYIVWQSL